MTIKIIYETQTGTTEYVAQVIQDQFLMAGHQATLHSIKYDGKVPDLNDVDLLIVGGPTYDDGKLEKNLREWIEGYHPDLSQLQVAVFGLGNRTYPLFCVAADVLEAWVKACGGIPLVPALKVNGFPDHLRHITEYVQSILKKINPQDS